MKALWYLHRFAVAGSARRAKADPDSLDPEACDKFILKKRYDHGGSGADSSRCSTNQFNDFWFSCSLFQLRQPIEMLLSNPTITIHLGFLCSYSGHFTSIWWTDVWLKASLPGYWRKWWKTGVRFVLSWTEKAGTEHCEFFFWKLRLSLLSISFWLTFKVTNQFCLRLNLQ